MINIADIDISEGATKRMDCPSCKGKNTFTVSKLNGVVVYHCYRASCGLRGASMVGMSATEIQAVLRSRKEAAAKEAEQEVPSMEIPVNFSYDLSDKRMKAFIDRWDLEGAFLLYDVAACRAWFMLTNERGRVIDAVGRTLRGDTPKWLRANGNADYYVHATKNKEVAVVVEDAVSAFTVHKNVLNAVGFALLGTNLNNSHIEELKKYKKVIVALDPDASLKSLQLVQKLKGHGVSSTALLLKNDIKYKLEEDMTKLYTYCS